MLSVVVSKAEQNVMLPVLSQITANKGRLGISIFMRV